MESVPSSGGMAGYPDSADSSPRSRGGESWDEGYAAQAPAAGGRIRLMCSFGGRIVPRPTDRSLCYLGGETKIVAVDRNSSLADVTRRLGRSLLGGRPFALKYQLPSEDLDSLISVSTDEDFDNLVDEYDRLVAAGSKTRIRVFLFPSTSPSSNASSVGSLLDGTPNSETWFVDALNSAIAADSGGSLDGNNPASVNSLLGLEDDSSVHSRTLPQEAAAAVAERADLLPRQDVQSVPNSPMMDKNSSFGSASSAPSLANLPPIRVRTDDRVAGIDDQFGHLAVSEHPSPAAAVPPVAVPVAAPVISSTEGVAGVRVYSDDDDKADLGGGDRRTTQQVVVDSVSVASAAARANYFNDRSPPADPKRDALLTVVDSGHRIPAPVGEASYVYTVHHQPQQQQQPMPPPPQHPQQFVPASNAHYLQAPAGATYFQLPSYYHPVPQQQQSHGHPSVAPTMYYVPVHQNPGQPYNLVDPAAVSKSSIPMAMPQPTATQHPTAIYHGAVNPASAAASAPAAAAYTGMSYHVMGHPHPTQTPATAMAAGYGFEYPDPSRAIPQPSTQVYFSQAAPPPTLPSQYHPAAADMSQPDALSRRTS